MRQSLRLHPDSQCSAVKHIEAEVARPSTGSLVFSYFVSGRIADLSVPAPVPPTHADGLWRHTCFEAFVRIAGGDAYYEFNFSPSKQWAAYRFDGYRSGMHTATGMAAPRIAVQSGATHYSLQAALELDEIPTTPGDGAWRNGGWRIGLAAVIEEVGGQKSYWALAHPPGKADFHHSDGFALLSPEVQQP
jgi:hypothetical protein